MRILHYTLGLPPYRGGGLTKYATDLMLAQTANGDVVSLLYPGNYTFWRLPEIQIVKNKTYKKLSVFEIVNPSVVPLLYGVHNPSDILGEKNLLPKQALEKFYNEVKPEVMHIHTFMGLPPELIVYLKEKGVRTIFTSHDYFGLCLKVNFINKNGVFCDSPGGIQCAICNRNAPSSLFLRLRNSKYLLKYKAQLSSQTITTKKKKNKSFKDFYPTHKQSAEYVDLLDYYKKLFDLIDYFHFNSNVSKEIYEQYVIPKQSSVLPISHSDIKDFRSLKKIDKNHVQLAFIGSTQAYKGFPMLKEVLCELNNKKIHNWSLQVWGGNKELDNDCDKIIYKGKYSPDNLEQVFNEIDLLLVPSIWHETFSLITLEALSYGVPVLVSNNVGAKDIIKKYNPDFVYLPFKETLYTKLHTILSNPIVLEDYNNNICMQKFEYFLDDHTEKVYQLYQSIITLYE